jgi:hypothetical protein
VGVSCSRCKKALRAVDVAREGFIVYEGDHSQLPTLYSGVVCTRCGKVECTNCRLGGISRPCFWCGNKVEPAYDHALRRYRGAMPPASRLLKNAALIILVALAAVAVQRVVSPRRSASADGAAARVAEVEAMADAEALAAVVRDEKEPVSARIAAVRKVEDDDLLDGLARDEGAPAALRTAAVKAVIGQEVLAGLATDTDLEPSVREAAIKRLDDPDILRSIAASDSDYKNIQRAAQERLRRLETE